MISRSKQRIERIKKEVPLVEVLLHYGYRVHTGGGETEIQFPCDLHGDGSDNKPSARVYPATGSFYCFACAKIYDAIDIVQIKENLNFSQACHWLEHRYDLPPLPWSQDDSPPPLRPEEEVNASFKRSPSYEEDKIRVESMLEAHTQDRILPMRDMVGLWELFDMVCWYVGEGQMSEDKGRQIFQEIRRKVWAKENGDCN